MNLDNFCYSDERFADLQLLRYRLKGFEQLSSRQKAYVYCLSQATLYGRDITFDQFCSHNLRIRKLLEAVCTDGGRSEELPADAEGELLALQTYLKRVWFSNGIHHHYGCEKFTPAFTPAFLRKLVDSIPPSQLPLREGETVDQLCAELFPVIFNPQVLPKRVNKADGADLVQTSACNYYEGVSQIEVEAFYAAKKKDQEIGKASSPSSVLKDSGMPSYGLNTRLVKRPDGQLEEQVWHLNGLYGKAIERIIHWLREALCYAENNQQVLLINLLVKYYETGDLKTFDDYSVAWVDEHEGQVDFVNGFIEVYGDPLGLKASWEGIVHYKDLVATHRTQIISQNAQWFGDHSPVDPRFRKPLVTGVTANVVCASMLGGDEYPSTAIGINLPNADWIRARYGSKSVTIGNLTEAYSKAAKGNGFREEFVADKAIRELLDRYSDQTDDLHTDLHECLGHGSGQLLPDTDPDALKAYGNTIEEARADLFGLYYMADEKLVELGLLSDAAAYKAQYYSYLLNGLLTQLTRIKPGHQIEEAHMRNRALIARWVYAHAKGNVMLEQREGKTFLVIADYAALRPLFACLLAEVQRIKSEGDFEAARQLVEQYAIQVDPVLHEEILGRYQKLNLAPYKGFINPVLTPQYDDNGRISDVFVSYDETYSHQMLRYSREYATL